MTSIQEQLKALKVQETALKAQLKKSGKKSKEELKNIADFKKFQANWATRPDFQRIIHYIKDIELGTDTGDLEPFQSWFAYNQSKSKTIKKIHEICNLIDGAYGEQYAYLRNGLLLKANHQIEEEEEN
jgi:hypothetical protein